MATEQAQRTVMQHNSPSTAIVRLLQKRGQASIKELELALGVTATAVREQLSHLIADGVVDAVRVRGDVGRPFYVYHLTDKAQEMFPKAYGTLARLLLEEVLVQHGPDAYTQLLERVGKRLEQEYAGVVMGREMEDRLYGLATLLVEQGFESEVTRTADGFVLHAATCPYFAVVKEHREICEMEAANAADACWAPTCISAPACLTAIAACQFSVRTSFGRRRGPRARITDLGK